MRVKLVIETQTAYFEVKVMYLHIENIAVLVSLMKMGFPWNLKSRWPKKCGIIFSNMWSLKRDECRSRLEIFVQFRLLRMDAKSSVFLEILPNYITSNTKPSQATDTFELNFVPTFVHPPPPVLHCCRDSLQSLHRNGSHLNIDKI